MTEIEIVLRFNRPCLGAAKKRRHGQTVFAFDRDPSGRVMFMPSAWMSVMKYAAKLANRHQAAVKNIDWCPVVCGTPRPDWRRTAVAQHTPTPKAYFVVHEAFQPGDRITLSAVLPDEINLADFNHLLTLVGKYQGFSPFNNSQEKYGTFEVVSVAPATGAGVDPN
jgi:hypothetical protein